MQVKPDQRLIMCIDETSANIITRALRTALGLDAFWAEDDIYLRGATNHLTKPVVAHAAAFAQGVAFAIQ